MNKLKDLKEQRSKLEERIKQLESELKKPLIEEYQANALEEENREVLNSLYRIEKANLAQINTDINKAT